EIFANEILLLAYYIATINIETAYHDAILHASFPAHLHASFPQPASYDAGGGQAPAALHASSPAHLHASSPAAVSFSHGESGDPVLLSSNQTPTKTKTPYLPFPGICLTDTFQMNRPKKLEDGYLPGNSERIAAQEKSPIQVIIGNPPYSTGQTNANDNNANMDYPHLNQRIAASYAKYSKATNKNGLYDSYILAFRWASDRIGNRGVIGFVTGSAWIERNFADGMRKCLKDEFSALYVFHTRGDGRKEMLSKGRAGEGQNIFGQATMTGIAISILVKNPNAAEQGKIYFYDIGDDLKTHEKIDIVRKLGSIAGISENEDWVSIEPDQNNDWLSLRNEASLSFMTMGDKKNKHNAAIFDSYSSGIKTQRDVWCYNFSAKVLQNKIESMIQFYNSEVERISALNIKVTDDNVDSLLNLDQTKIKWSRALKWDLAKNKKGKFSEGNIVTSLYRPFTKQAFYYSRQFSELLYQFPSIFPNQSTENRVITISGIGARSGFAVLMTDLITNLHTLDTSQNFPLKLYEKSEQGTLEGLLKDTGEIYQTRDGITNAGLRYFEDAYPKRAMTKEQIFYYIYGLLHHPKFREIFKNNLSKELPRIPRVKKYDDFVAISQIGRKLGDLHVGYEQAKPYPVRSLVTSEQYFDFTTKTSDG
ncbi:MAG: hypothetical protein ORN98_00920, partial [Alphaproteobacteria bacterium]|nr:hypothetical protein [Alphaproteobacteria bacterium]